VSVFVLFCFVLSHAASKQEDCKGKPEGEANQGGLCGVFHGTERKHKAPTASSGFLFFF
jgi:hypothetical protein